MLTYLVLIQEQCLLITLERDKEFNQGKQSRVIKTTIKKAHPFCTKSTFFSGRILRMWLSTWSALVRLVKVTLYWACGCTGTSVIGTNRQTVGKQQTPDQWGAEMRPERRHTRIGSPCQTLILRGPSRSPLFLFGVSRVMTLSRPRSRLPNTFPPLRFWALSLWQPAMSSERDLPQTDRGRET